MSDTFQDRRRCGAVTSKGQPCQAWAAVGAKDFRCVKHTEDPNRTGGGITMQARTPVCVCAAYADPVTGKPKKHRPGIGDCKVPFTRAARIYGDPTEVLAPSSAELAVPAPEDLTFEGIDPGPWQVYLSLIAAGGRLKQAAAAAGLTVAQVNRRKKSDGTFAEAFELAERLACDAVADAVYGLATGRYGVPSLEAARWWLSNRDPARWKGDTRSVELKGTVTQEHVIDMPGALAEIAALEAALRDRVAGWVIDAEAEEPGLGARAEEPPRALGAGRATASQAHVVGRPDGR